MQEKLIEELPDRLEKALGQLLSPKEQIHVKLKGAFKEGLVCTDFRVIILKGGLMTGQMFGNDVFQQPYSNITGVQVNFHLLTGYFEMNAGGMQNTSKRYWSGDKNTDPAKAPNCISLNSKAQVNAFREACTFILGKIDESRKPHAVIEAVASKESKDDIMSALEKLGRLKDSGVLTDQEFQAKKSELLSRL